MSNITRVSAPGESFDQDVSTTPPEPTYFDVRVDPEIFDRARREAREASYRNSEDERRAIAAMDAAVFDRVSASEDQIIRESERLLERAQVRIADSLTVVDRLDALRDRLRNGEDTATLAREFKTLQRQARESTARLRGLRQGSDNLRARAVDPLAAAQKTLSVMPRSAFRPLDPSAYLR